MIFAESPSATFSNVIAKIKGDRDGRCPRPEREDTSRRLRSRKLTLDDRLLHPRYSCRGRQQTVKILSRIGVRYMCTRGKVYVSSSKHIECSFIRRKSRKDRLHSSRCTLHRLLRHVASRRVCGFVVLGQEFAERYMHVSFL